MFTIKDMAKNIKPEDMFNPDPNLESDTERFIADTDTMAHHVFNPHPLSDTLMGLKDVNMEGFIKDTASAMKRLYIRFKEMLAKMMDVARKVWLRTIIFFSKSDDKLKSYKDKADKMIMIESKEKEELKDLLGDYAFNYKLRFIINDSINTEDLYTDKDYDRIRDIIKYVKKPKQKTVDYLIDKAHASYIGVKKDSIYMTVISKENNSDKYAALYKETIDWSYYNSAKKELYKDISDGDITEGIKGLFSNTNDWNTLKDMLSKASKQIDGYKSRMESLVSSGDDDTKRLNLRYHVYVTEVKYIYYTVKQQIRQTKLALNVGELLFD